MPNKIISIASSMLILCGSLTANAGVLGDFQTFVPNSDGLYFVTVQSAQILKEGTFTANFYMSYSKDHLMAYDSVTTKNRINYKDQMIESDGTIGYSVSNKLQLLLGATGLVYQKPDGSNAVPVTLSTGVHSFRPGIKWQFKETKTSQWAFLPSVDIYNVKDDPYTGVNPGPTFNIEGAWTGKSSKSNATHGVNVGFRKRNSGERPTGVTSTALFFPLKDQLTASYGYSVPLKPATRFVFETIGCLPVDKGENGKALDVSCLEVLAAIRHRINKNFAGVVGATLEPGIQTLAPAYRIFAGMNTYIYPSKSQEPPPAAVVEKAKEYNPLRVPSQLSVKVSESLEIPITGGLSPYSCEFEENGHTQTSLENCVFTAPPFEDVIRVRVNDSTGQSRTTEISVIGGLEPLTIDPSEKELIQGETQDFTAAGGAPPYTYSIVEGAGTIDAKTGAYRATNASGSVRVKVKDKKLNSAVAVINVTIPPKPDKVFTLKNVNFIFNSTELVPASKAKLDQTIEILSQMVLKQIIVEGHTDDIGNDEYNLDLSNRRAAAIAEILRSRTGLKADSIKSVGFGESKPIVANKDDASRLQNRRVELKIFTEK